MTEFQSNHPLNRQTAAARATANAIDRLKNAHRDEWETLYREARIQEGLPPEVGSSAIKQENMRLRARIAELEALTPSDHHGTL